VLSLILQSNILFISRTNIFAKSLCITTALSFEGPNPQWGKYSLAHGFNTFPSSLAWAKSFRIIGSVYDIENFNGGDLTEDLYENWLYEHKSLVDQLTK
jgi:hypothetical protein